MIWHSPRTGDELGKYVVEVEMGWESGWSFIEKCWVWRELGMKRERLRWKGKRDGSQVDLLLKRVGDE